NAGCAPASAPAIFRWWTTTATARTSWCAASLMRVRPSWPGGVLRRAKSGWKKNGASAWSAAAGARKDCAKTAAPKMKSRPPERAPAKNPSRPLHPPTSQPATMTELTGAPHQPPATSVGAVMRQVLYALTPVAVAQAWFFGWGVIAQILLAAVFALGFEAAMLKLRQ